MEILQRMYGSLTVLPPTVSSILEPRYLFRNCLHRVKHFIFLLARQAFSSFRLKPYLSLFVCYLKFYANEADCKQWRQRRFAYKNRCFGQTKSNFPTQNFEIIKTRKCIYNDLFQHTYALKLTFHHLNI